MASKENFVSHLSEDWATNPRWYGVKRPYSAEDVWGLRGSLVPDNTIARVTANKLWKLLETEPFVNALGCMTGGQAVECVKAGLKALYVSGWQVAADANSWGQTYPDQSLYPVDSVPNLVRRLNNALQRADQVDWVDGKRGIDYFVPAVADAEAGFGGQLNAFELMKAMIQAGAAGVHFEDQLSSAKKCGHLGGKVLVPASEFIKKLVAARLAADVLGVPSVIVARTDANSARLLTSRLDRRDDPFLITKRFEHVDIDARTITEGEIPEVTTEGFSRITGGIDMAIDRGLQYAPYADLLWCETSTPDLEEARKFADAIHEQFPGKKLAYNCSPSFNWKKHLDDETIAKFQKELGKMGYAFQFITLAGFHSLNYSMFELARGYKENQMTAYAKLQEAEFGSEVVGYTATRHQREVGTAYFDKVATTIGETSTTALTGSTEEEQF